MNYTIKRFDLILGPTNKEGENEKLIINRNGYFKLKSYRCVFSDTINNFLSMLWIPLSVCNRVLQYWKSLITKETKK